MDVYFLVLPDVHLLDMSGPVQAIQETNELHGSGFCVHFVGPEARVNTWQGLMLDQLAPLPEAVTPDSLVFVCGTKLTAGCQGTAANRAAVAWLQAVHQQGAWIIGICTGAFVLGAAGLLDGRRCTTHHRHLSHLKTQFPLARVIPERIFIRDQEVITSAGVTAGIDLTLALISELRGAQEAAYTARELVVYARRMADDPQISPHFRNRNHVSPLVHDVQDEIARNLCQPLTVGSLASRFNMSPRHLQRLFRNNTGISVKGYLTALRLRRAEDLLRNSDQSIERVAEQAGFQSARTFRDTWIKEHGSPPSRMRQIYRINGS